MAGIKIDNFAIGNVNLSAIMDTLQGLRQGHFQASLTEMDTNTIPEIAAGSIFDLNGSFVYVDADETIGGTPVDGVTYIKAIYSSGTVSFEWTATAPTFATDKNGWYGTSASSGHRYIAKVIKSSSSYTGKTLYDSSNISYTYETKNVQWEAGNIYSWNAGETKTATLTFTKDIIAITDIDINAYCLGFNTVGITSISFTGNVLTVTMLSLYGFNTKNAFYHVVATAAL